MTESPKPGGGSARLSKGARQEKIVAGLPTSGCSPGGRYRVYRLVNGDWSIEKRRRSRTKGGLARRIAGDRCCYHFCGPARDEHALAITLASVAAGLLLFGVCASS